MMVGGESVALTGNYREVQADPVIDRDGDQCIGW